MKGLIIKDLLIIKRNFAKIFIFMIILGILCSKQINILAFIFPFYTITMCLSTLTYDDYNKWYGYAITLPMGKKNIILAKYLMTLIVILFVSLLTFIIAIILSIVSNQLNVMSTIESISSSILCSVFVISVMYPVFIKFGSEKGRLIIFVFSFLICAITGFLVNSIERSSLVLFLNKYGIIILVVTSLLALIASYFISLHIFKKKDY